MLIASALFELSPLENLLLNELSPENIEQTITLRGLPALKQQIADEGRRVCAELRGHACSDMSEVQLERLVQVHQRETVKLLDQVFDFIKPDGPYLDLKTCGECTSLYLAVKAALKQVLNFIERDLYRYFDLMAPVPQSFRLASAAEIVASKNKLYSGFKAREIDDRLSGLVLGYLSGHIAKESCSYAEQRYAKLFGEELQEMLQDQEVQDWNRKLASRLIYLNFNQRGFLVWCRRYIAGDVDGYEDVRGQRQRFGWYLKELQQLELKPNTGYRQERPGIVALLAEYVNVELVYLEAWLAEQPGRVVPDLKARAEEFDFKLPLGISVDQLGLFIEIFIRTGVFRVPKGKLRTMMELLSKHVTTVGTEVVSAGSVNNKRKPELKTKLWMKEFIHKIDDFLDGMDK